MVLLKYLFPVKVTVLLKVPFLVNFLILKVAFPLELVLAVNFLFLILIVTLTPLIALPDLDFRVIAYFLVLDLALNVFFLAVILLASLVTLIVAFAVVALYASSPLNVIVACLEPVAVAVNLKVATPLELVFAVMVFPLKLMVTSLFSRVFPLDLRVTC